MVLPAREVLFQTQKEKKVKQLIKYARCLHGGVVYGIPGGADQIRSYHPTIGSRSG